MTLDDDYGTNNFEWGTPVEQSTGERSPGRYQTGGTRTYRIQDHESNTDFEDRINEVAEGLLKNSGATWIFGELKFKRRRYVEAVLHLHHLPMPSPVTRSKLLSLMSQQQAA